jgi:hypothetical protein
VAPLSVDVAWDQSMRATGARQLRQAIRKVAESGATSYGHDAQRGGGNAGTGIKTV